MDFNDLLPFLIGAPVLAAGAVAAVQVRRRRTHTPPPPAADEVPTGPTGSGTAVAEHPGAVATPDVTPVPTPDVVHVPEDLAAPPLETPAPTAGRLRRLRDRLARSGSPLGTRLLGVLSRDHLTEDDWDELEETLLLADVGAGPTDELIDALRTRVRVEGLRDGEQARAVLREQLLALVDPSLDRTLRTTPTTGEDGQRLPAVVLVVGVNGTGKTTTVGKLARVLVADGSSVVLGAADTFRAAAADQLQTWGSRVGVPTVRSDRDGADPAAVAFDAVRTGVTDGADVVLVDTAGRLQNKAGLMDELGKITRVITRTAPLSEVLLVLDATTGQNGLNQARVFAEVAGVTGIVLTKLDGTAKGGIVVAVQRELGVPVKLVGLGEGPDDLAPFDPEAFVDGLLQG
ncbi:signal recognition particle-docking protein FtsY [Cellulomonas wangsupingiae]|uniref:Signal recognition particle receptor FtsY n=1 Tax=Cellulomonas wangsupingiae TaxID=2968085 RepID=A0ABY5K7V6_9CELL|nr:signal recognition particle-docking protein FtsY [Cellulomonas wangsupingiae]MCM0639058.1 signal recognition particle-docking protein FtsY [Cellulomonas wangsupingiae]UUI66542.1 signal recognition particle-docking protein FtsY [Cellulomonas wangsupingiae]